METMITMTGIVVTDVKSGDVRGATVASFRFLSTIRRFERGRGWVDADTNFVTVTSWRGLALNVASSVTKGDPLVVFGKLRVRPWDRTDRVGSTVEVEAIAVGHDLARGTSAFKPNEKAPAPEREETLEETAARVRSSAEEEGLQAERAILEARRASVLDAERILVNGSAAARPADAGGLRATGGSREERWPPDDDSRNSDRAGDGAQDQVPDGGPGQTPASEGATDRGTGPTGADGSVEQESRRDGKRAVFGLTKHRERDPASV